MDDKKYFVHESSYVDTPCEIGEGTKIWHFSHVMKNAKIGKNCNIGQNVVISPDVVLGQNVKIQNNVSVYTGVICEDDVFLGPSMVFTNVVNPRSHVIRRDQYQQTLVKKGASIGANAVILCGNDIGRFSFIGAGAVITKDVPDYALVVGNPGRIVGWMCYCGIRLDFQDSSDTKCTTCGKEYTMINDKQITEKTHNKVSSVPLLDLKAQYATIRRQIEPVLKDVVESQYFILGPKVKELEGKIAAYSQCSHAIGVSSGTDALLIALMAIDLKPGDEVITTPFSFFATAGVIARLNAKPVFVDIQEDTYNLDPSKIESAISDKTKAIIPVHLFGQMAEMDPIMEIANKHKLFVIEDAAQAIGSEDEKGLRAGSVGHMGCFSFFPSKNLGGFGDAGMVVTNDEGLANKLIKLRVHGSEPKYYHQIVGGNFRIDALQAAILSIKLDYLDQWTESRQKNAREYIEKFKENGLEKDLGLPGLKKGYRHIYNQFVLRSSKRDDLIKHLRDHNIGCEIYYPITVSDQECFAYLNYKKGDFPVSEKAAEEVLAIPIYPELTQAQKSYIVETITGFYDK
ncbi:MAG: aminotransferase class V-fold PLP-dependent enzyme [Calditrichia bacterium]|nr:aminotransferase class V-fold PLP-dependent enzyme [Calditrichia bacterium]